MSSRIAIVAATAVLCLSGLAQAELLGLNAVRGLPDIRSELGDPGSYVTYGFNPDTLSDFLAGEEVDFSELFNPTLFAAHGRAANLDLDGLPGGDSYITDGTFDLTATIDSTGQASGGNLAIAGKIDGEAFTLQGDLSEFGFGPTAFEFLFNNVSITGSLASRFQSSPVGVILNAIGFAYTTGAENTTELSGLDNAFFVTQLANSNTFAVVPAPGAAMLAAIGLGLVSRYRRRLS